MPHPAATITRPRPHITPKHASTVRARRARTHSPHTSRCEWPSPHRTSPNAAVVAATICWSQALLCSSASTLTMPHRSAPHASEAHDVTPSRRTSCAHTAYRGCVCAHCIRLPRGVWTARLPHGAVTAPAERLAMALDLSGARDRPVDVRLGRPRVVCLRRARSAERAALAAQRSAARSKEGGLAEANMQPSALAGDG
jgi:hypothetical protein